MMLLELGKSADKLTSEDLSNIARYAAAAVRFSAKKSGSIPGILEKNTVLRYLEETK